MNISVYHNRKGGVRLRHNSVRPSDNRVLIDLGGTRLLLARATAVELTSQLVDLLAAHRKPARH